MSNENVKNSKTKEELNQQADDLEKIASKMIDPLKNKQYYSMKQAKEEFQSSYGAAEKTASATKILGKSIFNAGKFLSGTIAPKIVETAAQKARDQAKKAD